MRYIIPILILSALMFSSCKDDPVTFPDQKSVILNGYVRLESSNLTINFSDTCSYDFAVDFVNNLDSVEIVQTNMGSIFAFESKYYTVEYWRNHFRNDPTIIGVSAYSTGSTIIFHIKVSGKKSFEEEKKRFKSNEEMTLIWAEKEDNSVAIMVPLGMMSEMIDNIMKNNFIESIDRKVCKGEACK